MSENGKVSGAGDQIFSKKLLLINGKIVNADDIQESNVLIEGGIIKKIGKDLNEAGEGVTTIDCKGKLIIPGGVDINTHFLGKSNGVISVDDFFSGTSAAIMGGTTTIFNSLEVDEDSGSLISNFIGFKEKASGQACCDFGIHVTIRRFDENVANEMKVLVNEFRVNSFRLNLDDRKLTLSDLQLFELCELCRKLGVLLVVQPGGGPLAQKLADKLFQDFGIQGPEGHSYTRADELTAASAHRLLTIAGLADCPTALLACPGQVQSLVHSAASVAARANTGVPVFTELLAPALHIDHGIPSTSWARAAALICHPTLPQDSAARTELKRCLIQNSIDFVGSNHKRFTSVQKKLGQSDFRKIPSGIAGVGERMRLLWDYGVSSGLIDICKFVSLTSTTAAQLFNIYPRKGVIKEGSDADLVVWNLEKNNYISQGPRDAVDVYAEAGWRRTGVTGPEIVLCAGQPVWRDCELTVDHGRGRFLRLAPHCPFIYRRLQLREKLDKDHMRKIEYVKREEDDELQDNPRSDSSDSQCPGDVTAGDNRSNRRPIGKCGGGRNMQESTFSLSGSQVDDSTPKRSSIRTQQPPGGKSTHLW